MLKTKRTLNHHIKPLNSKKWKQVPTRHNKTLFSRSFLLKHSLFGVELPLRWSFALTPVWSMRCPPPTRLEWSGVMFEEFSTCLSCKIAVIAKHVLIFLANVGMSENVRKTQVMPVWKHIEASVLKACGYVLLSDLPSKVDRNYYQSMKYQVELHADGQLRLQASLSPLTGRNIIFLRPKLRQIMAFLQNILKTRLGNHMETFINETWFATAFHWILFKSYAVHQKSQPTVSPANSIAALATMSWFNHQNGHHCFESSCCAILIWQVRTYSKLYGSVVMIDYDLHWFTASISLLW